MRLALILACLASSGGIVVAQTGSDPKQPNKSDYSTGRTMTPEDKGQLQPQGWTGPIETTTGGAPADRPQGPRPPGMQAAPEGSSKTVGEPDGATKSRRVHTMTCGTRGFLRRAAARRGIRAVTSPLAWTAPFCWRAIPRNAARQRRTPARRAPRGMSMPAYR